MGVDPASFVAWRDQQQAQQQAPQAGGPTVNGAQGAAMGGANG
jgi:hypothetical protein